MTNLFTPQAVKIEPRLKEIDFDFRSIFDIDKDSMFISGSVVEGFGNKSSDVDIYIINSKDIMPKERMDELKINYTNSEIGYYNEVNTRQRVTHNAVRDKINNLDISKAHDYAFNVQKAELSYYYRVCISVPLIENDAYAKDLIGFSKEIVAKNIEYFFGYRAYCDYINAKHYLQRGHMDEAYCYANQALHNLLDSYAAFNNECYISNKFMYDKIKRIKSNIPYGIDKITELRYLGSKDKESYCSEVFNVIENFAYKSFSIQKFMSAITDIFYRPTGNVTSFDFIEFCISLNGKKLFRVSKECFDLINWIYKDDITSRNALNEKFSKQFSHFTFEESIKQLLILGIIDVFQGYP
jgi:predicted nucleotidyltransferase